MSEQEPQNPSESEQAESSNNDLETTSINEMPEPEPEHQPVSLESLNNSAKSAEVDQPKEKPKSPYALDPDQISFTNENVTMTSDTLRRDKQLPEDNERDIVLPNIGGDELSILGMNMEIDKMEDEEAEWLKNKSPAVIRAVALLMQAATQIEDAYTPELTKRKGSKWRQEVEDPLNIGGKLAAKLVETGDKNSPFYAASLTGAVSIVQIPLFASGFWIAIRSPKLGDYVKLDERLGADKIAIGRESSGQIYSNLEVYTINYIVDFILERVYWVSLPNKDPKLIKSLMKSIDIPQLIWGICVAMYVKGYPLSQPCLADPENCQHVSRAMINLGKISWTDIAALTDEQVAHMAKARTETMQPESVLEYQKQFVFPAERLFYCGNRKNQIRLGIPSVADHVQIGTGWIQGIVADTQKAFGKEISDNERLQYMDKQARSTFLRQFSHWVEAVIVDDGDGNSFEITAREKIDDYLEEICAEPDLSEMFISKVLDYIRAATVTLIAINKEPCPKCQKEIPDELTKHPELIPLDVVSLFFTLRSRKVL